MKHEKYRRNVLEITIEASQYEREPLTPDFIADICASLGMSMEFLEGHRLYLQGRATRVDIWGKEGYSMDLFMRYTPFQIHGGWQIKNFRLSGSQIQNVNVIGLEITTNN